MLALARCPRRAEREHKTIELSREDGIATATLNRPERLNALSGRMLQELGKEAR
jgi:enoyl-CoA hydratase/carnithine racemase